MSESEFLKRISELETQNFALIAENKRLREILGLPQEEVIAQRQQDIISIPDTLEKENTSSTTTSLINIHLLKKK